MARRAIHERSRLYDSHVEPITAFVLAGGKSLRMGQDKALLRLGGKTLLERALELARTIAAEVKIVGDPIRYGGFGKLVKDVFQDHGPLAGIHAALVSSSSERSLILGVDMPFLTTPLLGFLIGEADGSDALVTVPRIDGTFQPLCAVYRKPFAGIAEAALVTGKNKVHGLFANVPVRAVDEQQIEGAGFSSGMFRNVNTPEDFAHAARELS